MRSSCRLATLLFSPLLLWLPACVAADALWLREPALSPDGKQLAFTWHLSQSMELRLLNSIVMSISYYLIFRLCKRHRVKSFAPAGASTRVGGRRFAGSYFVTI